MSDWPQGKLEFVAITSCLTRISVTRESKKGASSPLHAYFLERPDGNVLFNGPDRVPFYREHAEFFEERGGIALQALTHAGDATKTCGFLQATFGAPVRIHEAELAAARFATGLDIEAGFKSDEPLVAGVHGIHLPGHAVGYTAFRFESEGATYLVCGHAVKQTGTNGWAVGVAPPMIPSALRSLELLRELEVDFLLPDYTNRDPAPPVPFDRAARDEVADRVRAYISKKHRV